MTHADVIARFKEGRVNRLRGECSWSAGNVSCDERALYSFGWYAIAYRLRKDELFILNGDQYSMSTAKHIGKAQRVLHGPTISFSVLQAANLHPEGLGAENILDWTEDEHIPLLRDEDGRLFRLRYLDGLYRVGDPFVRPKAGMWIDSFGYHSPPEGYKSGAWHTIGGCLVGKGKRRLLCTLDANTYCGIECPDEPTNIAEAFESLKPVEVRGVDHVRQGEWFFVDTGLDDEAFALARGTTVARVRETARAYPLPLRDQRGNPHICRQYETPSTVFVGPGVVRHPQHRTLELSTWHMAYRNRELDSWQAEGKID